MESRSRDVLTITSTARPRRVAFVIDPSTITVDELDTVIQRCSTHWGGGFWPIVPTDGQVFSEDWWSVLEAVDPDVVYALCALTDQASDRINRRLAPAVLINASPAERTRRGGHLLMHSHDIESLEAYQLLADHMQRRSHLGVRFLHLTDSGQAAADRAFFIRNFGTIQPTLATRTAYQSVEHELVTVHENTKSDVLARFLKFHGEMITPRDLCRLYAPRPFELAYNSFTSGFQLVIGDTVDDVAFAWNRGLTSEGHAGRDVLWLDGASARDPAFIRLAAEWIKHVFWNQQQQLRGVVVSYSEDVELLSSVAAVVREVAWLACEPRRLEQGRFPFEARPQSGGSLRYPSLFEQAPRRSEHIPLSGNRGMIGVPRPSFVTRTAGQGGWMLDLDVEYHLDPPRYSNRSDSWRLPRRAKLGHLFCSDGRTARIIRGGLPSLAVSPAEQSITLRIPSKRELLWSLLEPLPPRNEGGVVQPKFLFGEVRTSEQGRRFRGMVELFGGVDQAGRIFEDSFWRTVFLELAGKPADDLKRRVETIVRELRGASKSVVPEDDHIVAERIAKRLHRVEPKLMTFSKKQVCDMFSRLRGQETVMTEKGERHWRFSDVAKHELESLLEAGVLLQGVTLTCPSCGIEQWRIVDDLASSLRCEGCTASFRLPTDPEWRFRLNGLVQSALARDGVLPLLHALYELSHRGRDMVLVIPPQELLESYDGRVLTDLDMVLICDGRFIIGEAKSQPAAFDDATVKSLGKIGVTIRPDMVVVAAPGSEWPDDVRERLAWLKQELRSADVELKGELLAW